MGDRKIFRSARILPKQHGEVYEGIIAGKIPRERQRRRQLRRRMLTLVIDEEKVCCTSLFIDLSAVTITRRGRCSPLPQLSSQYQKYRMVGIGLGDMMKGDSRKPFECQKKPVNFILKSIRPDIEKNTVTEIPVSPGCRLAICLFRLKEEVTKYTIAELFGLGMTTVHNIVKEVCEAIIRNL